MQADAASRRPYKNRHATLLPLWERAGGEGFCAIFDRLSLFFDAQGPIAVAEFQDRAQFVGQARTQFV